MMSSRLKITVVAQMYIIQDQSSHSGWGSFRPALAAIFPMRDITQCYMGLDMQSFLPKLNIGI